jgi:hypothetical protein
MNGPEQRDHKTALNTLAHNTELALDAVAVRLIKLDAGLEIERDRRKTDIDALIGRTVENDELLEGQLNRVSAEHSAFCHRHFWSRLNWLITGR